MHTTNTRYLYLTSLLAVLLLSSQAVAIEQDFAFSQFKPSLHSLDMLVMKTSHHPGHLKFGAGLFYNYASRPLVIYGGGDVTYIVNDQMMFDVIGTLSLLKRLSVGVGIPFGYSSGPGRPGGSGVQDWGLGDIRAAVKFVGLSAKKYHVGVAVEAEVSFPTHTERSYMGSDNMTFAPRLVIDGYFKGVTLSYNLGYLTQKRQWITEELYMDDQLQMGLGAMVALLKERLFLMVEFLSATDANHPYTRRDRTQIEMQGGVRYRLPMGLALTAGFGGSLRNRLGSPRYRVVAGVEFIPGSSKK